MAEIYETGGLRIDAAQRVLLAADGMRIALSSRAFELLLYFVRHPGELLDKDRLMAAVWPNTVVEENNLNQCIGALRKALGESPGEHRFLVNEPGRGYRFVAPVQLPGQSAPQVADRKGRRRWRLGLGLALLVVLVAALPWWLRAPAPITDRSIAVLPFENRSAARENEYLALGVQDEILTLLTRVGDLRVLSRNSTQRYAGSAATARQIGRELGVSPIYSREACSAPATGCASTSPCSTRRATGTCGPRRTSAVRLKYSASKARSHRAWRRRCRHGSRTRNIA